MNKELKDKWIAALRSGEYKQGRYQLRDENGAYCCLGVLHHVSGVEPIGRAIPGDPYDTGIAENTRELLGKSAAYVHTLTVQNDSGDAFCMIADWIEENIDASE